MPWSQTEIKITPKPRGFHLITREITDQLPDLNKFDIGIAQIFIMHTSASLSLNENASPDVLEDMEAYFNRLVPENAPYFKHTMEGPDDMPAHIKSAMLGSSLMLPVSTGRFRLGTWQGIYLCEHRNYGGSRRLVVTISGE